MSIFEVTIFFCICYFLFKKILPILNAFLVDYLNQHSEKKISASIENDLENKIQKIEHKNIERLKTILLEHRKKCQKIEKNIQNQLYLNENLTKKKMINAKLEKFENDLIESFKKDCINRIV